MRAARQDLAANLMDDRLTSILRRYSHGEISAERAADEMGTTYNVADVYVLSREAGLPLPDPDGPFERAQFERAKRLFADVPGSSQRSEKHA